VRLADGSPAIVKDLKPLRDVADELRGAHYLSWRDGAGAVRLLGLDGRQMLLEYAGERLLLDELRERGDGAATDIAAGVLRILHAPSDTPPPADLQPLRERFEALFQKAETDRKAGMQSLYVEASEVAEHLLADPRDMRPLHGDLHHENIMFGLRGWLAIDPKGVLGDPAFDAANFFYNPLGHDDLCRDPARIAHMASIFAKTINQDDGAILDHAFAYGCLSAAWHAEGANEVEEKRTLSIAEAVRTVRRSGA
jgi:streptomycin 6-kinase